jgi:hypothetical protein
MSKKKMLRKLERWSKRKNKVLFYVVKQGNHELVEIISQDGDKFYGFRKQNGDFSFEKKCFFYKDSPEELKLDPEKRTFPKNPPVDPNFWGKPSSNLATATTENEVNDG